MNKNTLIIALILFNIRFLSASWQESPFFNTAVVKDISQIVPLLQQVGFQEGFYKAEDNINVSCFYRIKPQARYNLVIYLGWAGRSYEPAPFAAMLDDQPCNLFFLAGRNSQWEWRFNSKVLEVGDHSHRDIKAAIEFVHKNNKKPIILLGSCGGAFYSAQALLDYNKSGLLEKNQLKGLIFDSGWADPDLVVKSTIAGFINRRLDMLVGGNGNISRADQPALSKLLQKSFEPLEYLFYKTFFSAKTKRVSRLKNLHATISQLPLPIFFIHSEDDYMATIDEVKKLAQKAQYPTTWWLQEPSRHALHHIKYKEQYKERLIEFINFIL